MTLTLISKPDERTTAAEAIRAAGLDWPVALESVYDARGRVIAGARALVRTDRKETLSVVGTGYQPIQNVDAFRFADGLVGPEGASYESAGLLEGGRRVWLQARLPGEVRVAGDDTVKKYLLLLSPHLRGRSLWALMTGVRVACENRLLAAIRDGQSNIVRIRHTGSVEEQFREAQRLLGLSLRYYEDLGLQAQEMARRSLTGSVLEGYFERLVPNPKEADASRARGVRDNLVRLFETGRGSDLPSARGTLWGALNAAVEYVDYERPTRALPGESPSGSRWKSAQFGSGAALKARAWQGALALLHS